MTDREKVIKGLKCCYDMDDYTCRNFCPYREWIKTESCLMHLVHDAITLLKAQEPRVMSLEEVKALQVDDGENAPVWMETRILTDKGVLTYFEASILWTVEDGWWRRFGPVHSGWEDIKAETYDVTWRCWTAKPTDEQRKKALWRDDD